MSDESLFAKHDMIRLIHAYPQAITKDVNEWPKDKVLSTPVDDLVASLVQKYALNVPKLLLDGKFISHSGETKIPMRNDFDYGMRGDRTMPAETVTLSIPFEGDRDLFFFTASTRNYNPPRGSVANDQISFTIIDRKLNADTVKQQIDRTIHDIEMHLDWLRNDANPWNRQLEKVARDAVDQRKRELMARDNVVASLGIPLATRAHPAGFQSVSFERKPRPVTSAGPAPKAAFTPEPALNTAQYDDVMKAINRLALMIERSPQTFSKLGESEIRDLVLVNLNSDFDRSATGETFNGAGKTDILVNENGKNVFVGECKIWTGEKAFLEAIDQLQSYSTWRDSKGALLIFCRNSDFTAVLKKIAEVVPTHPNFKKQHSIVSETETRYVFRHRDDASKEMLLAVTVFHIPDGKDRTK